MVDDERHITRLVQANMERQGWAVTVAYDGKEAIECLERERFDRAILDLVMPGVDGYEVLEWIRTREAGKGMWVTVMTTNVEEAIRRTEAFPADLYVSKPFDPRELMP